MVFGVRFLPWVDPGPNIRYGRCPGDLLMRSGTDFENIEFFGPSDSKMRFSQIVSHQKIHVVRNQSQGGSQNLNIFY